MLTVSQVLFNCFIHINSFNPHNNPTLCSRCSALNHPPTLPPTIIKQSARKDQTWCSESDLWELILLTPELRGISHSFGHFPILNFFCIIDIGATKLN